MDRTLQASDQLWSIEAIARFLKLDVAEAARRVSTGELPTQRSGKLLWASRARLEAISRTGHFNRASRAHPHAKAA